MGVNSSWRLVRCLNLRFQLKAVAWSQFAISIEGEGGNKSLKNLYGMQEMKFSYSYAARDLEFYATCSNSVTNLVQLKTLYESPLFKVILAIF